MISQATKKAVQLNGTPLPLLKVISRQTLRQILSVDEGRLTLSLLRERQQPSALPAIANIAASVDCSTEARRPGMFTVEFYYERALLRRINCGGLRSL